MDNEIKQMFELILQKFDGIDVRLDGMEKRQEEMYLMQRSLEENIKITKAEQEKMMYTVADIEGKVIKLSSQVEDHESVIRQIRAIK